MGEIVTMRERDQVRTVAARWRRQYADWISNSKKDPEHLRFSVRSGIEQPRTKAMIAADLDALDPETATAADVEAIVGNRSWVRPFACDTCDESSWDMVEIGQEGDGSSTACVCAGCLRRALSMLGEAR